LNASYYLLDKQTLKSHQKMYEIGQLLDWMPFFGLKKADAPKMLA
jgi:hypothetical protein